MPIFYAMSKSLRTTCKTIPETVRAKFSPNKEITKQCPLQAYSQATTFYLRPIPPKNYCGSANINEPASA
jgi:hypothetical protein